MTNFFFAEGNRLGQFAAAGLLNAALPSLALIALTYLLMRLKAWNSASRYWAWWVILAVVIALPIALVIWHPATQLPAKSLVVSEPHVIKTAYNLPVRVSAPPAKYTILNYSKPEPPHFRLPLPPPGTTLLLLCAVIVFIQLSRVAFGFFAGLGLKRRASVSVDAGLMMLFARCVQKMRLSRKIGFALSHELTAPVALGYWRPVILFPGSLVEKLGSSELEQVLCHELAHISRRDDWMIALERLIESLFAFHPLVRWVARRIDLEREMACDDFVIVSSQPKTYAACLTKIAEISEFGSNLALTLPLLARKSHLAARIEMMLDRTRAHVPSLSVRRLVPFAAFGILSVCLSLRAPLLIAFPIQEIHNGAVPVVATPPARPIAAVKTPEPAVAPSRPTEPVYVAEARPEHAPVPASGGPAQQVSGSSNQQIDSIAITSADGKSTIFEDDGNEQRNHSPFPRGTIVFQQNGESYIIRDRQIMDAAHEIMKPQAELERQQEALGSQQEKLGEQQEKLGQQQEALANTRLNAAAVKNLQNQLHQLEQKLHSMDLENTVKTVDDAQQRIGELQELIGEMQSKMGEEQSKIGDAQGKLGAEQGKLGEQQGRLGEQQGKLGEEQAREAKRALQQLKELIRRAQSQNLAQPLR